MAKTAVTLQINDLILDDLRQLAERKGFSLDFLAGVALSNLLDDLKVLNG